MRLLILLIGIAIGAAAVWLYRANPDGTRARETGDRAETAASNAGSQIEQKLKSWDLDRDKIREELNRTGQVIRRNATNATTAIADATADARITGAIKAKLVADRDLSAWNISVNTTEGIVTLSGSVDDADDIGKAMALAMEADGVREVISTLQLKAAK